jgi:hypothetical protein
MSKPSYQREPRVDAYIDALPEWQQAVCHRVRDLVHAADPEVRETIKRRVQPTLNERALKAMFEQIIANNRAGGWRKLKAAR